MKIKDKVAIVTGASSGIGLATARLLTKRGAKIALVARSLARLKQISKELPGSIPIRADMTRATDVRAMVRKVKNHFGRIDVLVNNAGQGYDATVEKIDIGTFRDHFELNTVGPLVAMQSVIPIMRKQKGGVIVNVSSGLALMLLPGMSAYASVKRALGTISLTAREELKDDHIHISVVYPYITATEFEKNTIRGAEDNQGEWEEGEESDLPPADPPEHIAVKILEAIENNEPEVFAHEWMRNMK
jgi:short-subunit dehydrogenase